jgi:hypothetical protein
MSGTGGQSKRRWRPKLFPIFNNRVVRSGKKHIHQEIKKNLTSSVSDIKIERSSAFLTTFYKKKKKEKLLSSSQKVTVPSEFFFI